MLSCCQLFSDEEEKPEPPTNLVATIETNPQGQRFIRLHWQDNSSHERGFKLARKVGTGMYWIIQSLPANTTTYDDYPPDTNFGSTYGYKLNAFTNYYFSDYSNEVVITFM